ncbi:hypothetical protein K435DRAFT_963104 [Dendrothele bispora CBS 962.96]|uniref:Uncharacterized protein n=1 Tax=Dendrothele bispora (strain CBS 962.96) TaxID=1314807 RepID=A0A4S8MI24_DENBC|nr:hypothetical protein K435DRAFT_963104 [Dendrothele bispora CBS 962.96]
MATHTFGYSRSTRAKCHGPAPCKGSTMPPGTLRYGKITQNAHGGENVEWMHWGCVTPRTLAGIASGLENINGFKELKSSDQQKIRRAIAARHVDPADVPATARKPEPSRPSVPVPSTSQSSSRTVATPNQVSTSHPPVPQTSIGQNKRKAQDQPLRPSQLVASQVIDIDELEDNGPEEDAKDELYCSMRTDVVGLQYYKGMVGPGEEVLLIREPQNPYDRCVLHMYCFDEHAISLVFRNAIQVKNIGRTQVGHLPRNVAAKLAPLMDQKLVNVEGVIHDGNLSGFRGYTLKMTLKIYGASDKRDQLEPKLVWATPGQRGFQRQGTSSSHTPSGSQAAQAMRNAPIAGSSKMTAAERAKQEAAQRQREQELRKASELGDMLRTLEKKDDDERRSSLLDNVCSVDDIMNLPEHPSPPGIQAGDLKVDLLKHQKQSLKWCIEREYPKLPTKETDRPVQFWELKNRQGEKYYYNVATKTPQKIAPLLGRGAIVADAMGLGKTLTMLALMLATKEDVPSDHSKATLVVVPLSVLSNWEKQIQDHCANDSLSYFVYYGNNRSQLGVAELAQYDAVFTTYQTVTGEHDNANNGNYKKKKMERPLFEIKWKRVILDEGHTIRNPKTKMAKAACGLQAQRRWVLTGTPIINSVRDLGSLLSFLQICSPLDNHDFFNRLLLRPLKNGDYNAVTLLRTLMNEICIRRTKDMQDSSGRPLVPLPPVEMVLVPVALSKEARELYEKVEELSQQRFQNLLETNNRSLIQSNALALLTRLRQLALHPGLLPPNYLEQLNNDGTPEVVEITPEVKEKLQDRLAQFVEDSEECPVCLATPTDPKITHCAHVFCFECIKQAIERDPRCPNDRNPLTLAHLIDPRPLHEATQFQSWREENDDTSKGPSAKIEQLINLLHLTPGGEKSLVFSQFTSFLDKIAEALEAEGIPYVRFDGQMSAQKRQAAIARFSVPLQKDKRVAPSVSQNPSKSQRQARRVSKRIVMDDEDIGGDEDDDDFVAPAEDDDSDFDEDMYDLKGKKAKGKGKQRRSLPESDFDDDDLGFVAGSDENPAVMLISLKAGALGLNLTVANNVYLMDPWWQEGIESQAIDRVNRIGQTKPVHVYQLISENTVESKVLDIQERKKKLISEAFSGRAQTQTQKREARMQELMELLGVRQQEANRSQQI